MPRRHSLVPLAAVLALALVSPAAEAISVSGEPLRAENAKREPAAAFKAATLAPAATLRFQPLAAGRLTALQRSNAANGKRLQVGINRSAADEAETLLPTRLDWVPVAGGQVLRFDVVSPGAAALRVGLDTRALPAGAELRVAGVGGVDVVERVDRAMLESGIDASGTFWGPVTEGETQRLEVFVPAGQPAVAPAVRAVSHQISSPFRPINLAKSLGSSGRCNIDVVCRHGTLGQAFINAENAVARMLFTTTDGSFTCTGTLLNDSVPATQVPYFYSAAHCISQQSEASTLTTFWRFQTPTCGVQSGGANVQLTGGSDLLHASLATDAAFLRLRATPPAGAFFSGWNASTLTAPTAVTAIHHPQGDNKKVSRGTHSGFQANVNVDGQLITSTARASWTEGTTEVGSSGSGLFSFTGSEYQLRGGLAGGSASCDNSGLSEAAGNVDFYSRFDQVFPALQQWLAATPGAPTRDYTGAWFVPTEAGWGLTIFNFPGQMFALLFVYDSAGRPAWYRMQGPWTGTDVVTATLDRPTGPAWSASFNPNAVSYTVVGSATLTFTSATAATLQFNDGTVSRTVTLTKI